MDNTGTGRHTLSQRDSNSIPPRQCTGNGPVVETTLSLQRPLRTLQHSHPARSFRTPPKGSGTPFIDSCETFTLGNQIPTNFNKTPTSTKI